MNWVHEMKIILSSKISRICLCALIVGSFMSFFMTINSDSEVQTKEEFEKVVREEYILQKESIQIVQNEYKMAIMNKELNGVIIDVIPKTNALALANEQLDDIENTIKQLETIQDIDKINKIWNEYQIRTHLREASTSAVKGFDDKDPIHVLFYEKIKNNEALSELLDTKFDFEDYLEVDYNTVSVSPIQAQHGYWYPAINRVKTDFYNYEHNIPTAIYDHRGISLFNTYLFMNNSIFGVCLFILAVVFFYLNAHQFCKLRMDQYYVALPMSRSMIWVSHTISNILSFLLIVSFSYLLPLLILGGLFGFDTISYAGMIDTGIWTSYIGDTQKFYDDIFNYIPYVNASIHMIEGDFAYPGMAETQTVISYGICMIIMWMITVLQIIALGVTTVAIRFGIRRQRIGFVLILFILIGLAITRILFVPGLSYVPILYSSALFLLAGGHGIGQAIYWISLFVWILVVGILGINRYKKVDVLEG